MTLIIGRVDAGKMYIVGDTALTFNHRENTNPFVEGCLKQYKVNDQLAVAFAGIREHFEYVLLDILQCKNAQDIISIAIETQVSGLDYELIVADSNYDKIHFIKNAYITESKAGYIGNSDAFNSYQKYFHNSQKLGFLESEAGKAYIQMLQMPEPLDSEGLYPNIFQSLKKVIWDKSIPSVGGVIVPLCTHKGRFQYMAYADVVSDPINIDDFSEKPRAIKFGTAERGGYSVEFWDNSSKEGTGHETGFYFLQGGFGVCFPKGASGIRNAMIVKARTPACWVLETKKLFGHGISSGYLTEDHCGLLGEELLELEKYEDALYCYELRKDSKSLLQRPVVYDRYMAGYATAVYNCGRPLDAVNMLKLLIDDSNKHPCCSSILSKILNANNL